MREWLGKVGVKTLCIGSRSPWEHGYVESLSGKLRDDLLNGEIFHTVAEAGTDRAMARALQRGAPAECAR